MVVEGAGGVRLELECDGGEYHGADKVDVRFRERAPTKAAWTLQSFGRLFDYSA
jgi:hypothetical protein